MAERRGEELAGQRERAGRAEGEAAWLAEAVAREQGRAEAERKARAEAEAERDAARAELEGWMAGGPFARALRVFLYRKGRI